MNKFFLCLATALLLTLPAAASASDEGTEKNAQERNGGEKAIGPLRIGMSLREALNLGAREVEPGLLRHDADWGGASWELYAQFELGKAVALKMATAITEPPLFSLLDAFRAHGYMPLRLMASGRATDFYVLSGQGSSDVDCLATMRRKLDAFLGAPDRTGCLVVFVSSGFFRDFARNATDEKAIEAIMRKRAAETVYLLNFDRAHSGKLICIATSCERITQL